MVEMMPKKTPSPKQALWVLSFLFLAACQTLEAGKGPLNLAESVDQGYQEYLKQVEPLAFAVSEDGQYGGWYFCTQKAACNLQQAKLKAVKFCTKSIPEKGACKIYALGKKVVWDGPVTIDGRPPATRMSGMGIIGRGRVLLSRKVTAAFDKYRSLPEPLAFAVSEDGQNGGWYSCAKKNTCLDVDAKAAAIESCQKFVKGNSNCRIYAIGKVVVWNGPVTVENSPKVPAAKPDLAKTQTLSPPAPKLELPAAPAAAGPVTEAPDIPALPKKPVLETALTDPSPKPASTVQDVVSFEQKLRKSKAFQDIEDEIKRLQSTNN